MTKPNDILRSVWQDAMFICTHDHRNAINQLEKLEKTICQAKATLEALEAKQKIWDQKEARQEDQPEQEHSTQPNDQKLPEKEQSQRTRKANKKQYIISYPKGTTTCIDTGITQQNCTIAEMMLIALRNGKDVTVPNTWRIQVVDLC